MKTQKILCGIFFFGTALLLSCSQCVSANIKNSTGKIAFRFEPVKIKIYNDKRETIGYSNIHENICNGVLVKKENEIYFLTVAHFLRINKDARLLPYDTGLFYEIMEERKFPEEVLITLPAQLQEITVKLSKDNAITGDRVRDKKQEGGKTEEIDLLCIKVTTALAQMANTDILSYEDLADESKKTEIADRERNILICGYPAADPKKEYEELSSRINQPVFFSGLLLVDNSFISAFTINVNLKNGDCGRPILMRIGSQDTIIGLVEKMQNSDTGEWLQGIAIDSTAMRRIIDTMHNKIKGTAYKEEGENG